MGGVGDGGDAGANERWYSMNATMSKPEAQGSSDGGGGDGGGGTDTAVNGGDRRTEFARGSGAVSRTAPIDGSDSAVAHRARTETTEPPVPRGAPVFIAKQLSGAWVVGACPVLLP